MTPFGKRTTKCSPSLTKSYGILGTGNSAKRITIRARTRLRQRFPESISLVHRSFIPNQEYVYSDSLGPASRFSLSEEGFMPGATTVGLVCKDGAILASERRYSYGTFVMSKVAKKVFKITDNIGIGCAGIIGDMQVLAREANAYMSIYRYERGRPGTVKNTAKLFASILSSRRLYPYLAQTIIAGIDDGVPELFVLDPIGSVLGDKFAAVGTGAEIAMGVLEAEYRDGLSVEEARPLILRAIRSAIARDISSGDGVDLMIITQDGIKEESEKLR